MSNMQENVLNRTVTFTRNIMRNVYVWMTIALTITGLSAWVVSQNNDLLKLLFSSVGGNFPLVFVLMIAQVIIVIALSGFVMKMNPLLATLVFGLLAIVNGMSLSAIFIYFEYTSIARVFFMTAALFAIMSVYAFVTKRDLSSWGTILMMGVIGLFVASLINLFLRSSVMDYVISGVGVLIFTALTAYDTQRIKRMSDAYGDRINEADYMRLSILGALHLYLDFYNIFIFLLQFFGVRKD